MLLNGNVVTVAGNLAGDPELRFTPGGTAVCNMRVASNTRYFNTEDDKWDQRLDGFFNVTCWRGQAEAVASLLAKGDRVIVFGTLEQRSYEDEKGETRWVTEIQAEDVAKSLKFIKSEGDREKKKNDARKNKNSRARDEEPADVPF